MPLTSMSGCRAFSERATTWPAAKNGAHSIAGPIDAADCACFVRVGWKSCGWSWRPSSV